jgi:hypothetical protein
MEVKVRFISVRGDFTSLAQKFMTYHENGGKFPEGATVG